MAHAIGRIILALLGYVAAAFAASTVVVFALQGVPKPEFIEAGTGIIYGFAIVGGALYTMLIMAPSLVIIALSEAFSLRWWWLYLATGLVGALMVDANWWTFLRGSGLSMWHQVESLLKDFHIDPAGSIQTFFDDSKTTPILLAAGATAGLVYWLIAGRRAGLFGSSDSLP